jgi:glycosyltransferase involved in cell wall biosynthesis
LTLIGKGAPKGFRLLQGTSRVEVTGYVSDLQRYVSETAVFVVPLRAGAGMRVKILDAWCWGVPVVSTTVGAEGLKVAAGDNLLIADDEEAFVEAIVRVIHDQRLSERLADGGRSTVETHYDWKSAYRAWDQVYQS